MSVLPPPEEKASYVEQMFTRIAPGYDRMNRLMTFGMDRHWRSYAINAAAPPASGRALDLGTGTGDFLPLLAAWMPDGIAVGVDFSVPMMQAGVAKLEGIQARAMFVAGDALSLPFPDAIFDTIATGFMLRNVSSIDQALREIWRVARPGGVITCLEVARPRSPLLRFGHRIYFEHVVPRLARLVGASVSAYTYLPQSARVFPEPAALARIMQAVGWCEVRYRLLALGAVAVHTGMKPSEDTYASIR